MAAPADGSLYFGKCAPNLVATPMCFVERIRNGRIELVTGSVRESLDDGPATEVRLDRVFGLALGVNQALYISTSDRIRRISQGWVPLSLGSAGLPATATSPRQHISPSFPGSRPTCLGMFTLTFQVREYAELTGAEW